VAVLVTGRAHAAEPPSWARVEAFVREELARLEGYQPGDLLTQERVAPIVTGLSRRGWHVVDGAALVARFPAGSSVLAGELLRPGGTKFMRAVGRTPGGYDRADRLSGLRDGRARLAELSRAPDGAKLIEYLAGTSGGREMSRMLAQAPGGKNFHEPTGRLYDEAGLLEALAELHRQAVETARRGKSGQ
jgi:hypothetical protein